MYYLVTAKCGHVGKKYYMPIIFPIIANSKVQASSIAKSFPRVKRNHKDCIINCQETTIENFNRQILINQQDPYLLMHSKHEQNKIIDQIKNRLIIDLHQQEITKKYKNRNKCNLQFQQRKYKYLNKIDLATC